MRENIVDRGRPQMLHAPCRIQTHTKCNTHCFSTATMVLWTHLIVTLYVHCLFWWITTPSFRCQIILPTSGHTDCSQVYSFNCGFWFIINTMRYLDYLFWTIFLFSRLIAFDNRILSRLFFHSDCSVASEWNPITARTFLCGFSHQQLSCSELGLQEIPSLYSSCKPFCSHLEVSAAGAGPMSISYPKDLPSCSFYLLTFLSVETTYVNMSVFVLQ